MIEIKGKTIVDKTTLNRMIAHASNLRPAMGLVGEIVYNSILDNFKSGGRPSRWKPLAPATIKQRIKIHKWPGLILVRRGMSGGLMGSISYRPSAKKVVLSANKEYAEGQNRVRPFMLVQKNDWADIVKEVQNFIVGEK